MKILIFTTNFPLLDGGVAPYSYELARVLSELGHDILVLTQRYTDDDEAFDAQLDFPVIRLQKQSGALADMTYLFVHLTRVLITFRPNFIFPTAWLPCGLLLYPYTKLFNLQTIITAYALEVIAPQRRAWTRAIMTQVLRSATRLIAISHYTREQVLKLDVAPDKVLVMPMGIDPKQFPPSDPQRLIERYQLADKKVILTLARLVERKGQDMVLRAMPQVVKQCPDAVYVIAGKGPDERRLKALAAQLGIEAQVIFTGYVDDNDLKSFYQLCDIYIMPSREIKDKGDAEGFGITFLEANLYEKPVIGGRSGGVVDAIAHGESGLLVDPLSVDEIAQSLLRLLSDPAYAQQLGRTGRERAIREFNWDHIIQEHERLIQQLTTKKQ